ncbi:hypothetical protein EV2_031249 [Malus domestica]
MTNMSKSPFMDEIEQAEPPRKLSMPHFTSFKGDGDSEMLEALPKHDGPLSEQRCPYVQDIRHHFTR